MCICTLRLCVLYCYTTCKKNTYKVIFNKSSSLCNTDSVRNMVLHPKLVKGSFSRLIQFTSCVGWPSLALLLGYCTNWIIAITTVTFRRYGRVPLKTGARSLTCYHIYHLTLFILDTVLANSADPDEMPHKAAFHLVLHCLLRKKKSKLLGYANWRNIKSE